MRGILKLLLISACLLVVPGCGVAKHSSGIQVSNLTGKDKIKPDGKFDPKQLANASAVLSNLTVVDAQGHSFKLSNTNRPILFEAYWCPHCQRTLVLFNKNSTIMNSKPIIVSTGFPAKTTLKEAVKASEKEFSLLGVSGFTVYYALPAVQVPSYPTLLFHQGQSTDVLLGEHTATVWEQAVG